MLVNRRAVFLLSLSLVAAMGARASSAQCPPPRVESGPVTLSFTPQLIDDAGRQFWYHVPAGATRILLLFHGGGGSAQSWFSQVERIRFVQAAVDRGYAVGALDSDDRVNKVWYNVRPPAPNPDTARVEARLADLVTLGLLPGSYRLFGVGVSNGGRFVSILAQARPLRAMEIGGATGDPRLFESGNPPPTFWAAARNDSFNPPAEIQPNVDAMRAQGVPYFFTIEEPQPVMADSFTRIPGIDASLSAAITAALATNGLLDACGLQVQNPGVSGWAAVLPAEAVPFTGEIEEQLRVLYAEHEFSAARTAAVLDFFDVPACGQAPSQLCRLSTDPKRVAFTIKTGSTPKRNQVRWSWKRGEATTLDDFPSPLVDADYALCVYAGTAPSEPIQRASIPAGGQCGARPCWRQSGDRLYRYRDVEATPSGVVRAALRASDREKASVRVSARGELVQLPQLPLALPVTVQLGTATGACWQGEFGDPAGIRKNDAAGFRGTASR